MTQFIAVSEFVASRLRSECGADPHRVTVVHNGVDLDRFSPVVDRSETLSLKRSLLQFDESAFVVTYVGQLVTGKGVEVALRAAELLTAKHRQLEFVVIGEGDTESVCSVSNLRAGTRITFTGMRDNVEAYLKASDILVFPSTWEEAFGLVLAEAMACGIPVVASDVGAVSEIVPHMEAGILVPPGDPKSLASAAERLMEDSGMRTRFGDCGRRQAVERFGLDRSVSSTLGVYRNLLAH